MQSQARIEELAKLFERFLRDQRGLTGMEGARRARELRQQALRDLFIKTKAEFNEHRLRDEAASRLTTASKNEIPLWEDIVAFIDTILPAPSVAKIEKEAAPEVREIIGRIAPTLRTPACPASFHFWVEPSKRVSLGDLLVGEGTEGTKNIAVVGVVHNLEGYAAYSDLKDHFMACDLGQAGAEAPTQVPFILSGQAGTLWRSDGLTTPPGGDWQIRRAAALEIRRALSGGIPEEYSVPAGFVMGAEGELVPVDMDVRWLAGYEGGHINVAGISGVAAKTSYGVFLLTGLLALNKRSKLINKEGGLAVIAFNVKEIDLLYLEKIEDWRQAPAEVNDHVRMWEILKDHYGMDPDTIFKDVRYFAPGVGKAVRSLRKDQTVAAFSYGWADLKQVPQALYALFDPDDLDDKMLAAIDGMINLRGSDSLSEVMRRLSEKLGTRPRGGRGDDTGGFVKLGGVTVHQATIAKLLNRLNRILEATGDLLLREQPAGDNIPVDQLRAGNIWIIDITQLPDRARRFLFFRIMRDLTNRLQRRKAGETGLEKFPGRVVVMVDELNRFAPSGAGRHPTRAEIIGIATQGRSFGLTLLGLQQMASRIDEEVLTNSGTFAVGRAHPSELSGPAYGWLSKPLREQVTSIPTGSMLVYHPLWKQPVFIRFPLPPHKLAERVLKKTTS